MPLLPVDDAPAVERGEPMVGVAPAPAEVADDRSAQAVATARRPRFPR